jgi:hypothetical protein
VLQVNPGTSKQQLKGETPYRRILIYSSSSFELAFYSLLDFARVKSGQHEYNAWYELGSGAARSDPSYYAAPRHGHFRTRMPLSVDFLEIGCLTATSYRAWANPTQHGKWLLRKHSLPNFLPFNGSSRKREYRLAAHLTALNEFRNMAMFALYRHSTVRYAGFP